MADFEITDDNLSGLHKAMSQLERSFPRAARQLTLRMGNRARAIVRAKARSLVKQQSGNYHKRIKRGKVWIDQEGTKVRVYNNSPHAHLVEDGHRMVGPGPDKKELGFVRGRHVFKRAESELESQWSDMLEEEFDKLLSKL